MKNRKREICTSGSVRDEDGQPPHLLGHRRRFLHLAAGAAALSAMPRIARAQTYPSRPITMIVPFAPGGVSDVLARMMAEPLRAFLGQPVIIENVGGAAGSIGVGRAARAFGDGYTLSIGTTSSHVLTGALYALQWDLVKDLEPIAPLISEPLMIVGRKGMPAQDLKGLIAWLKANPDKASQGHAGVGGMGHITGISFQRETNTRFQFVPYRGGGPALQDLLAGHTDLEMEVGSNFLQQVRAGNLKAYAVAAKTRLVVAPDIPTVDEAGLPGFYRSVWVGLWMPKGAPKEVITKLNAAVQAVLAEPNLRTRIAELGQEIFPREQQTPEGLATHQKAEIEKWWPIIKAAGIKGE
jgi:tripartite-type tricarboxylate transporter receptor subunit TctC